MNKIKEEEGKKIKKNKPQDNHNRSDRSLPRIAKIKQPKTKHAKANQSNSLTKTS
jgi:hypothetical protein